MSLQTSSHKIWKYAISLVGVCIFLLFTSGSVFANSAQPAFPRSQLDFVPLDGANTVPLEIQNAMDQVPPDKLQAAKNAYELAKESPENVQAQTLMVNPSQDTSPGVAPQAFIPGVGQFTIRVYAWKVANAVPVPYGFGLYFPLATAKNLQSLSAGAAATITLAIIAQFRNLTPFSPFIGAIISNVLNTIPNYIVNQCQEQQGGGFTVAFANPTPIPVCGPLPAVAF